MILSDVFDYLKWRGDLSFLESPVNEIDSLIFCAFSYLDLKGILEYHELVTMKELYVRYKQIEENTIFKRNQNRLFQFLSESNRFKEIVVARYFNIVDEEKEMQIAGMTFILPNETLFVTFKGTDGTLTGWKENFNMSYMEVIPAEKKAVSYLNEILHSTKKRVYVGGHSKGGNLAMYASVFCENDDRVIRVYNHDGPGFRKEIVETELYKKRKEKMITFIPKASIVGNILNQDTKTFIIKSKQLGFLQHDLYSWLVENNHFVYTSELSKEAKNVSQMLNDAIDKIPEKEKEQVISLVYDFLESWNIEDIKKIIEQPLLLKQIYGNFKIEDIPKILNVLALVIEVYKRVSS